MRSLKVAAWRVINSPFWDGKSCLFLGWRGERGGRESLPRTPVWNEPGERLPRTRCCQYTLVRVNCGPGASSDTLEGAWLLLKQIAGLRGNDWHSNSPQVLLVPKEVPVQLPESRRFLPPSSRHKSPEKGSTAGELSVEWNQMGPLGTHVRKLGPKCNHGRFELQFLCRDLTPEHLTGLSWMESHLLPKTLPSSRLSYVWLPKNFNGE